MSVLEQNIDRSRREERWTGGETIDLGWRPEHCLLLGDAAHEARHDRARRRAGRADLRPRPDPRPAPTCWWSRPGTGSAAGSSRPRCRTAGSSSSVARSSAAGTPRTSGWPRNWACPWCPATSLSRARSLLDGGRRSASGSRGWYTPADFAARREGHRRSSWRWRRPSIRTTRGRIRRPTALDRLPVTAWLREAGATAARRPPLGDRPARAEPAAPTSGPRCWPRCARTPRCPAPGTTTTTTGRGCGSPRARPPWPCGWPPSWAPRVRPARRSPPCTIAPPGGTVRLASGEVLAAAAVVSALPVGPLRSVAVTGVSRRAAGVAAPAAQRPRPPSWPSAYDRPFWRDLGRSGLSECEGVLGSTWPQSEGVLSALIPPERYGGPARHPAARRGPRAAGRDRPDVRRRRADRRLPPASGAPTRGRRAT